MHRSRTPQFARAFLAALAIASVAFAQQQPVADISNAPVSAAPYRVGEKLTYTVSFSNFSAAAYASLYVAGRGNYFGREGVELRAHVRTIGEVNAALLKLDNYYFSFVEPATGQPYRAQTVQGDSLSFAGLLDAAAVAGRPVDVVSLLTPAADPVPAGHDFLSALSRLRALPLAPGARFRFAARQAGTQYDAELRVTGRETVNTPAGSFNALVATVRVPKNDAADDHRVTIYFTDDERHVPVLITARLRAGELRAALASDETVAPVAGEQIAAQPGASPPPTLPADPSRPDPNARPTPPRPTPSPTPATGGQAPAGLPYEVGEQLNFNFYLGNASQPVGTASFQVRSRGRFYNRDGMLLTATMSTNAALQAVFPVRDVISSYVDTRTLLPYRNELQIQEGSHRLQGIVTLDQERGGALLTDGANIEIPVGTYDLVSVLYALRSFDLAPPKRNAVSLLLNKRPRALNINSVGREVIEVGGQRISAYQLALSTDDAQGNRLQLRLWVGTDRRRLPLRLVAVTPLGPVRADLSILPLTRQ